VLFPFNCFILGCIIGLVKSQQSFFTFLKIAMKQNIYKMLLAIAVIAIAQFSNAQSPYTLNQVIVLNQGPYAGQRTTVGSYNPATKLYQRFDSIPEARFSSYVIIDNGNIYVAADSFLIKYDLATKQRLATQTVHGIREMAIWNNQLLVTRADVSPLTSYFQAYDKNSLSLIYESKKVSAGTEGIRVLNDTAYLAINNFGTGGIGKLAVIDLNSQVETREIDLGPSGINPFNVEVDPTNNTIYTINNLNNYDSTSITKYVPATGKFTNTVVNEFSGCGISSYYLNNIYFQISGKTNVGVLSTAGLNVWDSLSINKSIMGMSADSVHGYMYTGYTDYDTIGKVFIYDLYGGVVDSFASGIAPGNFAFDVSLANGVQQLSAFATLQTYPNPATSQLQVDLWDTKDAQATLTLTDVIGRQVYSSVITTNTKQIVPMSSLAQGIYILKIETKSGSITRKITKE
jgi:hypothetical protein